MLEVDLLGELNILIVSLALTCSEMGFVAKYSSTNTFYYI